MHYLGNIPKERANISENLLVKGILLTRKEK